MESNFIEASDSKNYYLFASGMVMFSECVLISNLKILIISKSHFLFTILAILISILFYISNVYIVNIIISFESYGTFNWYYKLYYI